MSENWFRECREQSEIKSIIVSEYFEVWAQVIISQVKKSRRLDLSKIAYIDLFAGPGRYEDGTKSTPLMVLEKAIKNNDMNRMLVTLFNDYDASNVQSLKREILKLENIEKLRYQPVVMHKEVGTEIVKMFEKTKMIPTLFFVDPWGYKGLSLKLINSVLRNWGCDCIFFFNYNRINMGINNKSVEEHLDALFGKETADVLRQKLCLPESSEDRELVIVESIASSLKSMGGKYVLPFRFRNNRGNRTSHHLIFVSKHFKGYEIMKGIMAGVSSKKEQGVASFEFSPADIRYPLLFELSRPLNDLYEMLLKDFAGRSLIMQDIYEQHSVDRPYIKTNYKDVLKHLEADGKISVTSSIPGKKRRKGTFADDLIVTFS